MVKPHDPAGRRRLPKGTLGCNPLNTRESKEARTLSHVSTPMMLSDGLSGGAGFFSGWWRSWSICRFAASCHQVPLWALRSTNPQSRAASHWSLWRVKRRSICSYLHCCRRPLRRSNAQSSMRCLSPWKLATCLHRPLGLQPHWRWCHRNRRRTIVLASNRSVVSGK